MTMQNTCMVYYGDQNFTLGRCSWRVLLLWNRLLAHSKKADMRATEFWRDQHNLFSTEYLKKDKELTKTRAELTDITEKRDKAMSSWNNLAVMA